MRVLPDTAHFDYVFEVTEVPIVYITGRLRERVEPGQKRLVGYEPVLEVQDYSPHPWQLFARMTLTPSDRRDAVAAAASFSVDRGLTRCLHPGDALFIRGVYGGSLGLSIVRDGVLVAAAGDLSHVPLGHSASVRSSGDLMVDRRWGMNARPGEDGACHAPVEVCLNGERLVLLWGRPSMGPYDVFVRGSRDGEWPCVSIERRGQCPETAAHTSAQLFDQEGVAVRLHGE